MSSADPVETARSLLRRLFAGHQYNALAPHLWAKLSALADRTTSIRTAMAPAPRAVDRATSLGDNWFQCPGCDDVFEGERARCAVCQRALAMAAPATEIAFGDDARIWIRLVTTNPASIQMFAYLDDMFSWLRVEAGARWFETYEPAARDAIAAQLAAKVAIPPNLVPLGVGDDGEILLAHETRLSTYAVRDGRAVATQPATTCSSQLVVLPLVALLVPGDAPPSTEGAAADRKLRAFTPSDVLALLLLGDDGYIHGDELLVLLRTDGVSVASLTHIARILMDSFTFIPGGTWQPKTLAGKRRPGSPVLLLQPIVDRLHVHVHESSAFADLACELLGLVLCDPDVYEHDALGAHADMATELVAALLTIELATLSPASQAHLLTSFERACDAADEDSLELVTLGEVLSRLDRDRVLAAMPRYFSASE